MTNTATIALADKASDLVLAGKMGCLPDPGSRGRDGGRGAVLIGTTDDRSRMRKGMIQINVAALLPPNEFAQ
jgi:hypothetical protein